MRLFSNFSAIAGALLLFVAGSDSAASSAEQSLTIYSQPISPSSKPKPLAQLTFNAATLSTSVSSYTPSAPIEGAEYVRVGLYDPKSNAWRGNVLTSASSFKPGNKPRLEVHVDDSGNVWHIGFEAYAKPVDSRQERKEERRKSREAAKATSGASAKKKKGKGAKDSPSSESEESTEPPLHVQIVKPSDPPQVHLNKPVVLNEHGKMPAQEDQKSFLQK